MTTKHIPQFAAPTQASSFWDKEAKAEARLIKRLRDELAHYIFLSSSGVHGAELIAAEACLKLVRDHDGRERARFDRHCRASEGGAK